uniref:Helicase/UvrB N-terminal domain-containing protein n=1 Tax=viral metagenome TaxID=1070528 RepID=A0A6C0M025_9ZZZZ
MDFTQGKLTKSEWDGIEVPDSHEEQQVYQLIKDGYHDVNIVRNSAQTLLQYMKIAPSDEMHAHMYELYFKTHVDEMREAFALSAFETNTDKKKLVKKADLIRIQNTTSNLDDQKTKIFEFVLLGLVLNLLNNKFPHMYPHWSEHLQGVSESKRKRAPPVPAAVPSRPKWMYYYYSICLLRRNSIEHMNPHVNAFINHVIGLVENDFDPAAFIKKAHDFVEKNEFVFKCSDAKLYEHQKEIFTVCKSNPAAPKLVLYIAPTGTGKTLTPIGLSEHYRVIFVCAARHVGLALAKACISAKKRVAFAFGCGSVDNIRLHYYAAKDVVRDRRTGGIRKVDNSVGDNVEIMISDIKSYRHAMYYMNAFNPLHRLLLYWDEPTITMDYAEHEFHALIKNNWTENIVPNVVLSSATLPQAAEMAPTIMDFQARFSGAQVHSIVSHDCQKTISLVGKDGYVQLPHLMFERYEDMRASAAHCRANKTLLRYFDLREVVKFITHVNEGQLWTSARYAVERHFSDIADINMTNIKAYYLELLENVQADRWPDIWAHFQAQRTRAHASNVNVTAQDAHTLTCGPTLFLANDVEKVARFALQIAQIPECVMDDLMDIIEHNNVIKDEMEKLEREMEDAMEEGVNANDDDKDKVKDKKNNKKVDAMRFSPEVRRMQEKIDELRQQVKWGALNDMFVPNRAEHLKRWAPHLSEEAIASTNPFTSRVEPEDVERIMVLPVENIWKVLLMMGIGVMTEQSNSNKTYTEIMKDLAQNQRLYLIIASTDYIYGTNYQFCHGYLGKDLCDISQEKIIQALGRIGRNKLQQEYTIRFRDDAHLLKIFQASAVAKPEVVNMARLLSS